MWIRVMLDWLGGLYIGSTSGQVRWVGVREIYYLFSPGKMVGRIQIKLNQTRVFGLRHQTDGDFYALFLLPD